MFLLSQKTHRMLIQYDPDVGHRFVPRLRARVPGGDGGYLVVTNSQGFRSDFEFAAAAHGRPRILMYGDSYTAGDNVENKDRYSDVLAALTGVEVQNYGVSGSGTDQHLLIQRKFGKQVEASLVMLCVQIDSFHRIQVSHRPSIDRVTGKRLLVPKPYFTLENGQLTAHHVPVPRERPEAPDEPVQAASKQEDRWLEQMHEWYIKVPGLKELRHSPFLQGLGSRLITEVKKVRAAHPYPDILSGQTPGWMLMEALLRQFIAEAQPLPVVIVPIPTKDFYVTGIEPVYQKLFAALDDPGRGVHVCDVSTRLVNLPYETRQF